MNHTNNGNPFISLLEELNPKLGETENMRTRFYENLMKLYFEKENIEILELEKFIRLIIYLRFKLKYQPFRSVPPSQYTAREPFVMVEFLNI